MTTEQINIQPANEVHDAVNQIISLCEEQHFVRTRDESEIKDNLVNWFVATINGRIVGCLTAIPSSSPDHTELGALVVTVAGKNISQQLIEYFNQKQTTPKAFAIVHTENNLGKEFFQRDFLGAKQLPLPEFLLESERDTDNRLYFEWEKV